MQRWVIISDVHVPFHDKKLWPKVLQCIEDLRPYGVIVNGDFLDLYSLGSYNADSLSLLRNITLGHEYRAGNRVLDMLCDSARGAKLVYLYGNHEDRYRRELDRGDRGKYAGALTSPTEALRLRERGFKVKDNWKQDYYKLGDHLEVTHGLYAPIHVAKKHLDEFQGSVICGHSHRFQSYVLRKRGAWNFGFLGYRDSPGFHYKARADRDRWVESFGVVDISDNGNFWVTPIQVFANKFICNGKVY